MGHESLEFPSLAPDENKFSPVGSLGNISDVMGHESREFPSLAPDENKFSPVGSLGNIKNNLPAKARQSLQNIRQ